METLILTGWGWSDYACAAALALRRFGQAEVQGVSTRRLPELLNEISGYKTILILGVGLTGNPELLWLFFETFFEGRVCVCGRYDDVQRSDPECRRVLDPHLFGAVSEHSHRSGSGGFLHTAVDQYCRNICFCMGVAVYKR